MKWKADREGEGGEGVYGAARIASDEPNADREIV
jgi:hypothetical protein